MIYVSITGPGALSGSRVKWRDICADAGCLVLFSLHLTSMAFALSVSRLAAAQPTGLIGALSAWAKRASGYSKYGSFSALLALAFSVIRCAHEARPLLRVNLAVC